MPGIRAKERDMPPRLTFGCAELLRSPSGVFALICLVVLGVTAWHTGSVVALAAFAGVIPAVLALAENRETLNQMSKPQP